MKTALSWNENEKLFIENTSSSISWYFSLFKCLNECFCFLVSSPISFFFPTKIIDSSSETTGAYDMSTICALFFARTKRVHARAWGPEEPHSQLLRPPPANGGSPPADICAQETTMTLKLGEKKTVRGGNTTQLLLNLLSLCKAFSRWKEGT